MCYIKHNKTLTKKRQYYMQQLKTITVKTSNKVESVHMETLYKVIENCYNKLEIMESDCTAASYFVNSAFIFAQLQNLYLQNETNNYVSLQSVMEIFANNITFYDEKYSLYESVVENTAMQNVNLENYTYLSN